MLIRINCASRKASLTGHLRCDGPAPQSPKHTKRTVVTLPFSNDVRICIWWSCPLRSPKQTVSSIETLYLMIDIEVFCSPWMLTNRTTSSHYRVSIARSHGTLHVQGFGLLSFHGSHSLAGRKLNRASACNRIISNNASDPIDRACRSPPEFDTHVAPLIPPMSHSECHPLRRSFPAVRVQFELRYQPARHPRVSELPPEKPKRI